MASKKKTKHLQRKTESARLQEVESIHKKGEPTFSFIDGGKGDPTEVPIGSPAIEPPNFSAVEDIIAALKEDKHINLTINDTREDPRILVEPNIKVDMPQINVQPTPVEVKVPTQRFPEPPPPRVTVKNEIDIAPITFAAFLIVLILALDLGVKIWQSQM